MHTHDRNVPSPSVFHIALIAALVVGIGCNGTSASRDAGSVDAGKDVAGTDGAKDPDAATPDLARGDVAPPSDLRLDVNVTKVDGPPMAQDAFFRDGGMGDVPQPIDVPVGTDAPADAASVDGHPVDDTDAHPGSDALSTSQARITFAFKNTGTQVVYLPMQCTLEFRVTAVETSTVYPNTSICLCRCSDPLCQDQPHCAPCAPRSGIAVEPGKTYESTWTAQSNTVNDKTGSRGTFKCIDYAPIPVGPYQVTIPVFSSAADAAANTNASTASLSFQLTSANAKIEVPIR